MAYFYVKTGGTATGTVSYGSRKTGSWSTAFSGTSEYYNDLITWETQASSSAGDIVYISDEHDSFVTLTDNTGLGDNINSLYCVDDDDLNILSTGAKETYSPSSYIVYCADNFTYVYGMYFNFTGVVDFKCVITYSDGYSTIFEKCTFEFSQTSAIPKQHLLSQGNFIYFKECIFNFLSNGYIKPEGGEHTFINCSFVSTYDDYPIFTNINDLSGDTTEQLKLIGCDFTQANRPIFDQGSNLYQGPYYTRRYVIDRCSFATNSKLKLPDNASVILPNVITESYPINYSTDPSYLGYYKYGVITTDTSVYRESGANYRFEYNNISELYEKLYPFSVKVTTYNSCTYDSLAGIRFKLTDFKADFSSLVTLTIFFACTSDYVPLTNKDFYVDVVYPDDFTDKAHFVSNMLLPFETENTYEVGGPEWTGTVSNGFLRQKVIIATTELGKEGLCSIWIHIFTPGKTIYFCPKVSIS